jgi:hypothetical protein
MVARHIERYSVRFAAHVIGIRRKQCLQGTLASSTTTTQRLMSSSWCSWHFFDLSCRNMVCIGPCARVSHAQVIVATDHVRVVRDCRG